MQIKFLKMFNECIFYKISREKLEPEPGFEPRTSGFLAGLEIRRSEVGIPVLVQIFLFRSNNILYLNMD